MRRSPHEVLVNIRFGSWHLFMTRNLRVSVTRNAGHIWHRQWWPPKFTYGEFRGQPGWRWFQIYRIGRWKP